MSQTLCVGDAESPKAAARRWLVLGIVAAAQFMFVVDAFVVNVALPSVAVDLHATPSQIESVVAVYLIAYAALIITGGRLGDIYGTRRMFIAGVIGFTLASFWCGIARTGTELIVARLAQGATAALMVPQVLATIHVLFSDSARARAFAVYGIVLGLGGAAGFVIGGVLVTLDVAHLGWRSVFFVNVPFGLLIALAAGLLMPRGSRRDGVRLDIAGAVIQFVGLSCVIGPLLFGRDLGWPIWLWLCVVAGLAVLAGFLTFERRFQACGGLPLIDLALLSDNAFVRGLGATFFFFLANLSFYFVTMLFLQNDLRFGPIDAGFAMLPLALAFVLASRQSAKRVTARGVRGLIDGCLLQITSLAAFALLVRSVDQPPLLLLMVPLVAFGYGQGLVMAPLSGVVLSSVQKPNAGSGSGLYGTVTQIANAAGVAVIGGVFFALHATMTEQAALLAALVLIASAIALCAVFLLWRSCAVVR